jgi:hypothetical protein
MAEAGKRSFGLAVLGRIVIRYYRLSHDLDCAQCVSMEYVMAAKASGATEGARSVQPISASGGARNATGQKLRATEAAFAQNSGCL